MIRREFLRIGALSLGSAALLATSNDSAFAVDVPKKESKDGFDWYDAANVPIEGRGWESEKREHPFYRFPDRWMAKNLPIGGNHLKNNCGMMIRFVSNTWKIRVEYDLQDGPDKIGGMGYENMTPIGRSGFDLYGQAPDGQFRNIKACAGESRLGTLELFGNLGNGRREYRLYLPLCNPVQKLKIGVESGKEFSLPEPRKEKPILFYGTSIVQGIGASRPGMAFPAIVGRKMNRPVYNFGFAGKGQMDLMLADAFAELDPAIYILDCMPNMYNLSWVEQRTIPFVQTLQKAHPNTPILLCEDGLCPNVWCDTWRADYHRGNHAALKKEFDKMKQQGFKNIHYLEGDKMMPSDDDGYVEGRHPNDFGYAYMARYYVKAIEKIRLG